MIRLVDEQELLVRFQEILEAETGLLKAKKASDWRKWIKEQPRADFVSSTGASRILRIPPPHVARLRHKGIMPEGIPVAGGYPVYLREQVEELAVVLESKRRVGSAKTTPPKT